MEYQIYWLLKSSCFEIFWDGKYGLFLSRNVDGNMIFTDYWKVLFLHFLRWGILTFFEPKSWWKDDIYWLLKSSCFELFQDGEYGYFFSQKADERWYLLITEKFLFWTFWWWEIRSLFQPKSWWNNYIYLFFFSLPWYSRTCEIWFFVLCIYLLFWTLIYY